MRFEWFEEQQSTGCIDYDLRVTTDNVVDEFVGYVRYIPKTNTALVRECLNDGFIPSHDKEFPTVRQAMRTLRTEIQVAIVGGATP